MPFTVSEDYKAACASGTVRLALALSIVCRDGVEINLTTFTRAVTLESLTIEFEDGGAITIPAKTYRAGIWIAPTDMEQKADISQVNNWELSAILGSYLKASDVDKKRFNNARWSLIEFIWDNPSLMLLRGRGFVGEVLPVGKKALFKMRGLEHLLQNEILPVTSPLSRARWGDSELSFFDLNGNTADGFAARVVTSVDEVDSDYPRRRFRLLDTVGQPEKRFSDGTARFTSGDNQNLSVPIMDWDESTGWITLCEDAPDVISAGDDVTAQIGAPRTIEEWRTVFGSGFGFPGEPMITTIEQANAVVSG